MMTMVVTHAFCIKITESSILAHTSNRRESERVHAIERDWRQSIYIQYILCVLCVLEHMQAKWKFPCDSMYMVFLLIFLCASFTPFLCLCRPLLLGPLSYIRIGIYCVIKISDKKIFIFCIFIFIAMLKRFSILFNLNEVCSYVYISTDMGENVHVNEACIWKFMHGHVFFCSFVHDMEGEKNELKYIRTR